MSKLTSSSKSISKVFLGFRFLVSLSGRWSTVDTRGQRFHFRATVELLPARDTLRFLMMMLRNHQSCQLLPSVLVDSVTRF